MLKFIWRVLRTIWAAIPWVFGLIWFMISLIGIALASFFRGIPNAARSIANFWLDRAKAAGTYTRHFPQLYWVFLVIAYMMIALSWITLATITFILLVLIL